MQSDMTFREFSLLVKRISGVNDPNMTLLSMALDQPVKAVKRLWDENVPVSMGMAMAIQRLIGILPQFAALHAAFNTVDMDAVGEEWQSGDHKELIALIAEHADSPFECHWAAGVAALAAPLPFPTDSQAGRDYDQIIKGLSLIAFFAAGRAGHATVQ